MRRIGTITCSAVASALLVGGVAAAPPPSAAAPTGSRTSVVVYDTFDDHDGYTLDDYLARWSNPYGPGEMASGGTRDFADGAFTADATPFITSYDVGVFDHIKYLAVSNQSFAVPEKGSVTFSIDIAAQTPGTQPGRTIRGSYTADGSPYAASTLEGQQAAATLHMIDFSTGQLFDWFVAGSSAFTLVERLPSVVTGSPGGATAETMYTQIIDEVPLTPGTHNVAIELTREFGEAVVEYRLDGKVVSKVKRIGVPLDVQGEKYTGTYPSLGAGELLADDLNSVVIGHGLFSLLDAFPFQHPDVPELNVSIPTSERLFGQGARATFDNVVVTTVTK